MSDALIGLDVGTTGVKAIAVSETGEVLARVERGYRLLTPRPGWSEQDPDEWVRASGEALAALGVEPRSIVRVPETRFALYHAAALYS